MDPMTISALIGLAGDLMGTKMKGDQAAEQAPMNTLAQLNPAENLKNFSSQFMVPGMQTIGSGKSIGQQLLGG